jgi:hypothetical protein
MLDKIQALIDAGNTVDFQCVKYNYAFTIERVITKTDNDLYEGFKHAGDFKNPAHPAGKISAGGKSSQDKMFIVQVSDKHYEVFDTEKNYLSGKRIDKPANFDELRKEHDSRIMYTYQFDDTIQQKRGTKVIKRKTGFNIAPDEQARDIVEHMKKNHSDLNWSNVELLSVQTMKEYEAKI